MAALRTFFPATCLTLFFLVTFAWEEDSLGAFETSTIDPGGPDFEAPGGPREGADCGLDLGGLDCGLGDVCP